MKPKTQTVLGLYQASFGFIDSGLLCFAFQQNFSSRGLLQQKGNTFSKEYRMMNNGGDRRM